MRKFTYHLGGRGFPAYQTGTLVIGSGCGGFNAADCLFDCGERDILLLTEGVNMGASRNTGSDKQTFYKLSLAADEPDSVGEMARTLFACGGMHGDTAMVEASCSVRSFMKLVQYGVPFPTNQYGAYVGYKTDHDPRRRATSAGPYTSRLMTECLERAVRAKGVPIMDGIRAVRLLTARGRCLGVLAVDEARTNCETGGLTFFLAENTILATGGPAGIYEASVYPESQTGMTGMAVEAGAVLQNLMDWQYGLASVKFRWNVSGTYQQALPRYISIDPGGREREFLPDHFSTPQEALSLVFQKGYQWPFDVRKLSGSSAIDVLVYRENQKGNRVFLDFTRDPAGLSGGLDGLSRECRDYLERSGAGMPLPIRRLAQMNAPAIDLYRDHGIDLAKDPLEIRVCAQHCCGGVAVDADWQTTVPHLYAVGEAAGTFGACRPGGTALASTQTGSLRAAEHISARPPEPVREGMLADDAGTAQFVSDALKRINGASAHAAEDGRRKLQEEFTRYAAHLRDTEEMARMLAERTALIPAFFRSDAACRPQELSRFLCTRDILLTQGAVLSAMLLSARHMGSRGSGLVRKPGHTGGCLPARDGFQDKCVSTYYQDGVFHSALEAVRPLPECGGWFESVWREFREKHTLP